MPRYFPKLFQEFKKPNSKISKSLGKYLGIPRQQHQNTPRIPQIPFKSTFYSIFLFSPPLSYVLYYLHNIKTASPQLQPALTTSTLTRHGQQKYFLRY